MADRRFRFAPMLALAFAFASTVALAHAALAADDAAAVKGTWKVSMEFQGQPVDVTLEIKDAEGGGLTGTWTSPRGTDALSDVKWDGKQLTFSRTVNRQGQDMKLAHTATVNGDTLEGKITTPQREIPFSGKRAS
jgi:uncharacterized protein involved in outer membrane biogenesis